MRRVKMKKPTKAQVEKVSKKIGIVLAGVALVVTGMIAQAKYDNFISHIKAQGVSEYQDKECIQYVSKELDTTWLECEIVHINKNK